MESNETWWDIRNLVFALRHEVGCQVAGDQVVKCVWSGQVTDQLSKPRNLGLWI